MSLTRKRCTKCVLSESFPRIKFDANGVCSYCNKSNQYVDTDQMIKDAKKKIDELFDGNQCKGDYDAIVCYSGGKDSTYTLQLAIEKYKLRVLAFTLDNDFISPAAWGNIRTVTNNLGVDHVVFKPNVKHFNAITKASVENAIYNKNTLSRISAVCNSCISMVNTTALKMALEKHIPFILAGFTLGQIPLNSIIYKNNQKFLAESRQASLQKLRELVGPSVDNYLSINSASLEDTLNYPHTVNILCIENISEQAILEQVRKLGWTSPGDVDGCSSNCMLNTFSNHVHEKIFDYNPYELELSHLIRENLLSRSEAMDKLNQRPENLIPVIKERLSIDDDAIERVKLDYAAK
ncbi:hypothetical protein SAMN02745866_03653 [Alteromonadaceae bacterium Bs31]|nr:hypothetical protein SAMN02745866_03653 [Alteromonadaceae bacterium Bs31]